MGGRSARSEIAESDDERVVAAFTGLRGQHTGRVAHQHHHAVAGHSHRQRLVVRVGAKLPHHLERPHAREARREQVRAAADAWPGSAPPV